MGGPRQVRAHSALDLCPARSPVTTLLALMLPMGLYLEAADLFPDLG